MTPLRQRMTEDMRVRNLASTTQGEYIDRLPSSQNILASRLLCWVPRKFAPIKYTSFTRKNFPGALQCCRLCSAVSLQTYPPHKLDRRKNPLRQKTKKRPMILSLNEVCTFIQAIPNLKYRVLAILVYATGLRTSEALHLRVCDIDSNERGERGNGD